ncbi:ABC transporter ATP-binding protein/permease [Poritiphilus flavus]|uniref:ATP-binding cassette domain-containing protein n=1 Tax=Poritiphilus flavus TaxID=2697053 RepID=A0A6L9EHR8_9FLAO|nr:ATP-binding cassette domain-containing protein [Poritiphilus flavus]NAS14327.1 ATP-binding cassette domain-containing protein [Poritiphilus flavus]
MEEKGLSIKAVGITKRYSKNKIGLQPMSMDIKSKSFVALMGPSGCGKSTLLKCLNGDNPATYGEVYIHGLSLLDHYDLVKKNIGYVPQDDIIHRELSVYKTLFYSAKLRLPDGTSNQEIDRRIDKVLKSLKLDQHDQGDTPDQKDIKAKKVKELSGGQRKRISIAVELLTEPSILFLDEPTSPLDPETIDSFLNSLKELAKEGTTIIMVTHKPEDLNYVDEVVFLGVKGHLVFKGPPADILKHFNVSSIIEVYSEMSDLKAVKKLYQAPSDTLPSTDSNPKISRSKADSSLRQLYWLAKRYLNIKTNDSGNLFLLLLQPLIVGGLVSLVFSEFRIGVLFLTVISAIWFGVSNSAKEIVGELPIYKRERMYNLNINTYILSKLIVLALIALLQVLIFTTIIYFNFSFRAVSEFPDTYLRPFAFSVAFLFFISFSASLIGLFLSSYFSNTEKVMTVVPITLMPQIMLAGVMTKLDSRIVEILSFFTLGRWGTEGFARMQDGYFQDRDMEPESVIIPEFNPDGYYKNDCKCETSGALEQLGLYDADLIDKGVLIGDVFNNQYANLIAVGLLSVIMYLLIFISLNKKDSL